jgi:hypothetical protein
MIQFYKPNGKNTGAACSFWYSPQNGAFFASIIRQASWDAKSKTGSFQKNKDNPQKNVKIKLNINELGAILDCIENNREFSAFHNSPQAEHITKMKFAQYLKDDNQLGFIFMASKEPKDNPSEKANFSIALNYGESIALRQCLLFMIDSLFSDKVEAIKNKQKKSPKPTGPKGVAGVAGSFQKKQATPASPIDLEDIVF